MGGGFICLEQTRSNKKTKKQILIFVNRAEIIEPPLDKTNNCVPSKDSDQPGHPRSLSRVFAVRSIGSWGPKLSFCGQRRLWLDWADDWVHSHFVGFVMRRLIFLLYFQLPFYIQPDPPKMKWHEQTVVYECDISLASSEKHYLNWSINNNYCWEESIS